MLSLIQNRLPSRREAALVFTACAFVINFWSIFNILNWMPSFLLHLRWWEILAVVSYIQAFALLESVIIFGVIVLAGVILPYRALRSDWVNKGSIFILVTGTWMVVYRYLPDILPQLIARAGALAVRFAIPETRVYLWTIGLFLFVWIASYLVGLRGLYGIASRKANRMQEFLERLQVLTYLYLSTGLIGAVIVLLRNL